MNFGELIAKGGALFARKGADALADTLETAPPADLARIRSSVSKDWADVIPAAGIPITDLTAEVQHSLRRISATVDLNVPVTLGRLTVAMTSGASLSFSFDFDFSAAVQSFVPGGVTYFNESVAHTANALQKCDPALIMSNIGRFQQVYITDRLHNQTYLCAGTIGPGYNSNVISIEVIGS